MSVLIENRVCVDEISVAMIIHHQQTQPRASDRTLIVRPKVMAINHDPGRVYPPRQPYHLAGIRSAPDPARDGFNLNAFRL
jgi:hypothetical protein